MLLNQRPIPMPTLTPDIPTASIDQRKRGVSSVWLIPLIAITLGGWLVWKHYHSLGPIATITFDTGDGVIAGKTKVRCRSVDVGTVESVNLSNDLQGVVTTVRMNLDVGHLLREDTQFWIVRPRVSGASGISGLDTIVSGSYLELDPGASSKLSNQFTGLDLPPVTAMSVPGLRVSLVADEAGSISVGSSVSYKGLTVGRIESRAFQKGTGKVHFDVFIEEAYANLVAENTRFWNVAGVDLSVNADGFRLRMGSLGALLAGGVEFGLSDNVQAGPSVKDGTVFRLHDDREGPAEVAIEPTLTYLLLFEDSVRGLRPQASVEFRGIHVGTVTSISFDHYPDDVQHRVPVIIQIDPNLIAHHSHESTEADAEGIAQCVAEGLRASLKTGSLLTGQLFVDLDFEPDAEPAQVEQLGEFASIPTASSGLARIEDKLVQVLNKLEALPVESVLNSATEVLGTLNKATLEAERTLVGLTKASQSIEMLLASESTQAIPQDVQNTLTSIQTTLAGLGENSVMYRDLYRTLDELRHSLQSIRQLADTVERKPNSLLFGRKGAKPNPPKAKR